MTQVTNQELSAIGLPLWLSGKAFFNEDHSIIQLQGISEAQAKSIGGIVKSVYDSGLVKSAWIPLSAAALQNIHDMIDSYSGEDDYAAYGSAQNIGKSAFYEMETLGWQPVLPDPNVLQERLPDINLSTEFTKKLDGTLDTENTEFTKPEEMITDSPPIARQPLNIISSQNVYKYLVYGVGALLALKVLKK